MGSMQVLRDGLNILLRYGDSDVSAKHDVLYAGDTPPEEMSPLDRERLEALGWRWHEDVRSWAHFT